MSNIIQLLPDSIANQIAAGEVVQRPSSAVKELLENAIDAGSTEIKVILKDAGKTLIQVIDNGKGMSEMDARMSFERHATSKIKNTEDLFSIRTMGFRGEALASIAAIAQVELISREPDDDLGTRIVIRGTKIEKQEPCQAAVGTSISVKNLFFNVPARRKFLKSDPTEYKHVLDEFHRVILAYPEIKFILFHNNNEVYHLPSGNLRQRIVGVYGKGMNEKLVPLEEHTEILGIKGFIVKPQFAKKSRSEQFLFVNNRFIKSPYLNHAIRFAFENLIAADLQPGFFIQLEIEPEKIDVNVHPTKQEIKFEEERLVYNYLKVAVRHALGKNNLTPMLDFEATNFNIGNRMLRPESDLTTQQNAHFTKERNDNLRNWESLYEGMIEVEKDVESPNQQIQTVASGISERPKGESIFDDQLDKALFQLHNRYIVSPIKSGFIMVDQIAAHERILYEENIQSLVGRQLATQKILFPQTIQFSAGQAELLQTFLEKINMMGFEIEYFGHNSFIVHGIPAGMEEELDVEKLLFSLLEDISLNREAQKDDQLAKLMAQKLSMNKARKLDVVEMQNLIDRLFACESPYLSPSNKSVIINFGLEEIRNRFNISK